MSEVHREKSVPSRDVLLAGAAAEAAHLVNISQELLNQIRLTKVARIYFVVITLLILAVCSTLTWIALSNRQINQSVRANTNLIISCTTASGQCHKDGEQQTATAVAAIVHSELVASYCSTHTDTFNAAEKCVAKLSKP